MQAGINNGGRRVRILAIPVLNMVAGVIALLPPMSAASPRVFKADHPLVKRAACELYLAADPRLSFLRLIDSGIAQAIDGEPYYDITGVLHELAGFSYSQMTEAIRRLPPEVQRDILVHPGAISVGPLLNTPVAQLRRLDQVLSFKTGERVVDLGAGHGAPAIYFAAKYPDTNWIGIELMAEKVIGAQRVVNFLSLDNVLFLRQDLDDPQYSVPDADTYYLLNPVDEKLLKILSHKFKRTLDITLRASWASASSLRYEASTSLG